VERQPSYSDFCGDVDLAVGSVGGDGGVRGDAGLERKRHDGVVGRLGGYGVVVCQLSWCDRLG
jgi:hypothetical protein